MSVEWWICPTGTCGHGRVLHDGDGNDEPFICCAEGCDCGKAVVTPPPTLEP